MINTIVRLSKYHPEANSRNALMKGDKALCRSVRVPGKVTEVLIDSELMKHQAAPGDHLGYECVFPDGRFFISADQLEIIRPKDYV